ncbi:HTH-type transcriptional regulator CueR [compost metagenome]|jgi:DNA-binding transcriptional MerR regulator
MSETYSISDLAREMNVTTRTIRFYEEQRLLVPGRRGQERIYSPRDRVTLKLILRGKRIGFSLAECKELIGMYDPAGGNHKQLGCFLEKIAERRLQLEQQMLDIQQMQLELNTAEQRCRTAHAATQATKQEIDNNNRRIES